MLYFALFSLNLTFFYKPCDLSPPFYRSPSFGPIAVIVSFTITRTPYFMRTSSVFSLSLYLTIFGFSFNLSNICHFTSFIHMYTLCSVRCSFSFYLSPSSISLRFSVFIVGLLLSTTNNNNNKQKKKIKQVEVYLL